MPRLRDYASIAFMTVALTSCMSCGQPASPEELRAFTVGKTTEPEVRAKLGLPNDTSTPADGTVTEVYSYDYDDPKWENFIPIAGGVAGGFDKVSQKDIFVFDKSGLLKSYKQTVTVNGVDTSTPPDPPAGAPPRP